MKNETTNRDPINVIVGWTLALCGAALAACCAACCAVAFPLLYLWVVGLMTCVGILAGVVVIIGGMEPLAFIFLGGDVLKAALYVIGAILSALADASK